MSNTTDNKVCYKGEVVEELNLEEIILRKLLKKAQYESEMHLGVNPMRLEQAHTHYLSEKDFGYVKKACSLIKERLSNPNWVDKAIEDILKNTVTSKSSIPGIKQNDELFKVGRGILESHLKEIE